VFVERLYDVAYAVLHLVPAFEVIGGVHSANVDFKPRLFFPTTIDRIRGFGDSISNQRSSAIRAIMPIP
jgi:hypothetical protein